MSTEKLPTPGSMAAVQLGCSCAVLDNSYGHGAYMNEAGEPQFWINEACKVHGTKVKKEDDHGG